MKVTLHNSCFAYLDKHQVPNALIENIRSQALQAWEKRSKDEKFVRIMVNIPRSYGHYFRFLTVLPYRKGSNTLTVRA